MIGRLWRGWTSVENADAYEALLKSEILPGIHRVDGYRGAYLLRATGDDRVEFVTVTLWDSLTAVRAFAGDDYAAAVVPSAARELLAEFDQTSRHYEVVLSPDA